MNSTPSQPPIRARKNTRQYSVLSEKPMKISAGKVKITPAATDSPAEPVVCTMLFSRIVDLPNARRMEIESTEIGIDAETVSPARRPTYTDTAPNSAPKIAPRITARQLNSVIVLDASTYGRNSAGGAVELHGLSAKKHLREAHRRTAPDRDLQLRPVGLRWRIDMPPSTDCPSGVQGEKSVPQKIDTSIAARHYGPNFPRKIRDFRSM
jgi:hypothetical protein